MGEIKFTNGLIMSALFAICIITFAIGFAIDNDAAVSLADDPDFTGTNSSVYSDLVVYNQTIGAAGISFNEDNVQQGTDTATSGGQFKRPTKATLSLTLSTLTNSWGKIFGGEFAILAVTMIAVFFFIGWRYAYKTWFGKDPD